MTLIALENYDLVFSSDEVQTFREMWKKGIHVSDIAEAMDRDEIEVAVLALDQRASGRIKLRMGAAFGTEEEEPDPNEYAYGRFTHGDMERMQVMVERRARNSEIAKVFGISQHYVNRIKRDMGWTRSVRGVRANA